MRPLLNGRLLRPEDVIIDFLCGHPPGVEGQRHDKRAAIQRPRVAFISMVEDILSAKGDA